MWDRIKGWSTKTKVIVGGLIVVLVLALAGGGDVEDAPEPANQEEELVEQVEDGPQDVDWENYAPEVQERIDRMAANGNCQGLQEEFDIAESNSTAQRNRVGDGNSDLMGYIDEQMRSAGCYSD